MANESHCPSCPECDGQWDTDAKNVDITNLIMENGSTKDEFTDITTRWIRILPSIEIVVSMEMMESFLNDGGDPQEDEDEDAIDGNMDDDE